MPANKVQTSISLLGCSRECIMGNKTKHQHRSMREREEKEKIEHFTLYPSDRAEETSTFPVFVLSPISHRLERFNIPIIHQSLCLHTCALSLLSGWKTRPLLGCTIVALRLVDAALLQCGTCDVAETIQSVRRAVSFQARCALSCWKCWAYKRPHPLSRNFIPTLTSSVLTSFVETRRDFKV